MPTLLPPSRTECRLNAAAYALTGAIGVSVILDPPILSALGLWLSVVWALCILTAFLCIPGALKARYRAEYVLLPVFTGALALAVVALWVHFANQEQGYTLPRVLTATILILLFSRRFWNLHRIVTAEAAPWTGSKPS